MDCVLCQLFSYGVVAVLRQYYVFRWVRKEKKGGVLTCGRNGLCWYRRSDLGLDHCYGVHSVRRNGNGRTLFVYADKVSPFRAELKVYKMLIYLWTSGGLYYAAAVLAPPGYGPFAAWLTGWSNWMGQITAAPSVDYAVAAMILAAASINNPDYVPANHQTFLLTTLILIVHTAISSMPTRWIAKFN